MSHTKVDNMWNQPTSLVKKELNNNLYSALKKKQEQQNYNQVCLSIANLSQFVYKIW